MGIDLFLWRLSEKAQELEEIGEVERAEAEDPEPFYILTMFRDIYLDGTNSDYVLNDIYKAGKKFRDSP